MKAEQWTKDESILVLDLYMEKPKGMKNVECEKVICLAQLLGRTPESLCRRMQKFQQWYPVLPFDTTDDLYVDEDPAIWNEYFLCPQKAHQEAPAILDEFCAGTLVLNLYFQLIINTMSEKSPEVNEVAKLTKRSAASIVNMLYGYASMDPFLKESPTPNQPLSSICTQLWTRYADDMDQLSRVAKYIESHYPKKRRGRKKTIKH